MSDTEQSLLRKQRFPVRLNDPEFEKFKRFVSESGLTKSEYTRRKILNRDIAITRMKMASKTIQTANKMMRHSSHIANDEILELLKEMREVIQNNANS
jgi:hypothetical protein